MILWSESDDGRFEEVASEVERLDLSDNGVRKQLIKDIKETIEYMSEKGEADDTE